MDVNLRSEYQDTHNNNNLIPAADGIRGMAFASVLLVHTLSMNGEYFKFVHGGGKIGVWLFFVLSSFLLTRYFLASSSKALSIFEWKNYFIRRFARIYPVYVIILFIYALFGQLDYKNVILSLCLKAGPGHFWTMPVEITFYFVLPIIIILFVVVMKRNCLATLIFTSFVTVIHQHFFPASQGVENSIALMQYFPVFMWGSFAAVLELELSQHEMRKRVRVFFDIVAVLFIIGAVLSLPGIVEQWNASIAQDYLVSKYIYFGVVWSCFIPFVIHGIGVVRRFFESDIMRFLGQISYGGYLIHLLLIVYAKSLFGSLSIHSFLFVVGGTIWLASLLNRFIEKPLIRVCSVNYRNTKIDERSTYDPSR